MNVNVWDVVDDLRSLILSGAAVAEAELRDPNLPLSALVPREEEGGDPPCWAAQFAADEAGA
jgi:hypothetical protein